MEECNKEGLIRPIFAGDAYIHWILCSCFDGRYVFVSFSLSSLTLIYKKTGCAITGAVYDHFENHLNKIQAKHSKKQRENC